MLIFLLSLTACGDKDPTPISTTTDNTEVSTVELPVVDLTPEDSAVIESRYRYNRVITRTPDSRPDLRCEEHFNTPLPPEEQEAWISRPLFSVAPNNDGRLQARNNHRYQVEAASSDNPLITTEQLPLNLRRYCLHQYIQQQQTTPPPGTLRGLFNDQLVVSFDQQVIVPSGLDEGQLFAEVFLNEVGHLRSGSSTKTLSCGQGERVRPWVALLDTLPTMPLPSTPLSGRSHGVTLFGLLSTMLTTPEGAITTPRTRLTTPLIGTSNGAAWNELEQGGTLGSTAWLAQAIFREVMTWKRYGEGAPLVLNLSLAWMPKFGGQGADRDGWPADVQAVYDALEYARCQGALIFVAAGNRTLGPDGHNDMLLPAAWNEQALECPEAVDNTQTQSNRQEVSPASIVYAVDGVGIEGRPFSLARPRTSPKRPDFVAYAESALLPTPKIWGDSEPLPLTGTSVSTVVVTAAASALWARNAQCTADEIAASLKELVEGPVTLCDIQANGCTSQVSNTSIILVTPSKATTGTESTSTAETISAITSPPQVMSLAINSNTSNSCNRSTQVLSLTGTPSTLTQISACIDLSQYGPSWQRWELKDDVSTSSGANGGAPQIVRTQPPHDGCPYCFAQSTGTGSTQHSLHLESAQPSISYPQQVMLLVLPPGGAPPIENHITLANPGPVHDLLVPSSIFPPGCTATLNYIDQPTGELVSGSVLIMP